MRSISTDYSQNPQQNVRVFFIYFCLRLSVWVGACFPLTFDLASQKQRERFLSADFGKTIVLTTQRFQIAIFSVHFPEFLIAVACLTRPLRRLRSPCAIHDANSKRSKTKIYGKETTHLLLQISAVICRYRPHLMIVMVFLTQNNF